MSEFLQSLRMILFSQGVYIVLGLLTIGLVNAETHVDGYQATKIDKENYYELPTRDVELEQLIEANKTRKKGDRYIFKPLLVRFDATIQQLPKKANTDYLLNALSMMGIEELPQAKHQMFIRGENNTVIAVYVEEQLAKSMLKHLKPEQQWHFDAIHSYNYHRGPALLLTHIEPVKTKMVDNATQ